MNDQSQRRGLYALMDAYCDGDRRAFERLHTMLAPRLRGFLMKLTRDEPTVDDLLQLTFLKAHLARERFTLQGGDPDGAVQGWYFAIARNVAMDHLRQRSRADRRAAASSAELRAADVADAQPNIEEAAEADQASREIVEQVRLAISRLPVGQREVVEMHKLRGMTMAEVAERLSIREGAARVRAHRGYKALARMLGSSSLPALMLLLDHWGPHV